MTAALSAIHGIQKPILEPSYDVNAYIDLLAFYISHPRTGQASSTHFYGHCLVSQLGYPSCQCSSILVQYRQELVEDAQL